MTPGDNWVANHDSGKLKEVGHLLVPHFLPQDRLSRLLNEISKETSILSALHIFAMFTFVLSASLSLPSPGPAGREFSMRRGPRWRACMQGPGK